MWSSPLLLLSAAVVTCQAATCALDQRPNIVYVNLDDVGHGDVSWHDSTMDTPNIKKIGEDGRFMEYYYTLQSCTPSRSALMSGRYPYRYGLAKNGITDNSLTWLSEQLVLLPQELKKLNYSTHMIGKWHIGHCSWDLTPLNRGFDTFYGKVTGNSDYFTHNAIKKYIAGYFDFFDQSKNVTDAPGKYSTTLFFDRAEKIIKEHSGSRPFFLYVAPQTAHTPFQVPDEYHANGTVCGKIPYKNRRIFCAMIAAADEGVGKIVKALKNKGMYDKTVIVVTTDNGASPTTDQGPRSGSNWPLRSGKVTLWEGGTRVPAVFKAPGLVNKGNKWNHLFHVVDWKPTLVEAACGKVLNDTEDDGLPMYKALVEDKPGQRTAFVYNNNGPGKYAAARGPRFKLIRKNSKHSPGWYPPETIQKNIIKVDPADLPKGWHLYDLKSDPIEKYNVYDKYKTEKEVLQLKDLIESEDKRVKAFDKVIDSPVSSVHRQQVEYMLPGWCEVENLPKSACNPNPCKNGGTCILKDGGYFCLCPRRVNGTQCDNAPPCKKSGFSPGSTKENAVSKVQSNGELIIDAVTAFKSFKANFALKDGGKAYIDNVTVILYNVDAKRLEINVYDGSKRLENGVARMRLVQKDIEWKIPFLLGPVGDTLVFSASPQSSEKNMRIKVLDVGYCLKACPTGWKGYNGSCYKMFSKAKYDDAKGACKNLSAELATAKTEAEFNFIQQQFGGKDRFWLGANDRNKEGTWVWEDGTSLSDTYTNWKTDEPDGEHRDVEADCLLVVPSGKWRDFVCYYRRAYVCKRHGAS